MCGGQKLQTYILIIYLHKLFNIFIAPSSGALLAASLLGFVIFFLGRLQAFAGPESQFGFLDLLWGVDPLFPFKVVGGLLSCDEAKDPFLLE